MNKVNFLFLGAVLTIAGTSAMVAGCGSDTTGTGGGSTGTGATSTAATGTGSTSATGSTGTGAAATLDCASYCGEMMTNCTGANEQYKSMESCLTVCAAFPVGKISDTDTNTLGCRLYHGGVAGKDAMSAATHCPHAGITGGDKDVKDAAPAVCGEGCDAFCDVAIAVCSGANVQYATKELCLTDCKGFNADVATYSTADIDKNDFGCRAYHLTVAATDAASATAHCGHIIAASPVCTK
jgi:hypothetical protein